MIGLDLFAWAMVLACLLSFIRAAREPNAPYGVRLTGFVMALICVAALSARLAVWWHA